MKLIFEPELQSRQDDFIIENRTNGKNVKIWQSWG